MKGLFDHGGLFMSVFSRVCLGFTFLLTAL
ncbi:molecular chaperone, partial [Escherichia coli]